MEDPSARKFAIIGAFVAAFLSLIPFLLANTVFAEPGKTYIGSQTANDDMMVYAAWINQAMEGNFFMDNRFTLEPQTPLTVNVWFFLLGQIAKITGIVGALTITRAFFSGLFVWVCYRFLTKVLSDNYQQKLAIILVTLGSGLGFLVWQNFGQAFAEPSTFGILTNQLLPIDVWQTEAFVFPSMLANGLFMVSLCLFLTILTFVLEARENKNVVWKGALCFLVLFNIHSYDVLLLLFILIAFLASLFATGNATKQWIGRVVLMGMGSIPSVLWFINVLQKDKVFQLRAATPTFAANFTVILIGILPLLALGIYALVKQPRDGEDVNKLLPNNRKILGVVALGLMLISMYSLALSVTDNNQFWMGASFYLVFAIAVLIVAANATGKIGTDLIIAWAIISLIAPYFPALFQRKLTMGISIPWAILATMGICYILEGKERGVRNLVAIFSVVLLSGSSLQWLQRELTFAKKNVSSTAIHNVYIPRSVMDAVDYLKKNKEKRTVVVAMPGISLPDGPGSFTEPYLGDANPILAGLSGVYAPVGHWSESPNYEKMVALTNGAFIDRGDPEANLAILRQLQADYVLAPNPSAYADFEKLSGGARLFDMRSLGEVVVDGTQFFLIKLPKNNLESPESPQ